MGNLGLAGAISGMGQGLERGFQQIQSGLIQHGLQDADRKFQSEKLKLQMDHAAKLQEGSQALTIGENEKMRTFETRKQDRALTHSETIQKNAFVHAEKETQIQIDKMVELQKLSSDQAKAFHKDATDLSKAHIKATQAGIRHIVPQVDGTVAGVMSDGRSIVLKDEKGNPIKGVKDVTKTTELLVGINKAMIEQYQRELTRNDLTLSPEERSDIQKRIETLRTDSQMMLKGPESMPKPAASGALKIPTSVAPTRSSSTQRSTPEDLAALERDMTSRSIEDDQSVPSGLVKERDPRSAVIGGLVPWAPGIVDYMRK